MNQLDELKKHTTIVTDIGNIESIKKFTPRDATANPSLMLKATQLPQYQPLTTDMTDKVHRQEDSAEMQLTNACDQVVMDIGSEMPRHVSGRTSTEVDARFARDHGVCVAKARKLTQLYEKNGIDPERILIKLAATWEGIRAVKGLEQSGIDCNLTLLFSFTQAQACAEVSVSLIPPFAGRTYDWYQEHQPRSTYQVDGDPSVVSMRRTYQYYESHGCDMVVMGASFRHIEQIETLAGYGRLTISPALLDELTVSERVPTRQLIPDCVTGTRPSPIIQAEFLWQHHRDPMVVEELTEGIRLFTADQVKLE